MTGELEPSGGSGRGFWRRVNAIRADLLMDLLNKALRLEYNRAVAHVERVRARHPDWDNDQVAASIADAYARDMSLAGAAAGGVAAVPVGGWVARVTVGVSAETAWMVDRTAAMILAVGHCYGHELGDFELRKFTVLRVMASWAGVSDASAVIAGAVGAGVGKQAVKAVPMSVIYTINRKIGARVIVKWGTKTGVVRLGSVVPFGIGAGLGAGGNYVMAKGFTKTTIRELKRT